MLSNTLRASATPFSQILCSPAFWSQPAQVRSAIAPKKNGECYACRFVHLTHFAMLPLPAHRPLLPILHAGIAHGLPLHIVRRILPASAKWLDVVDCVARTVLNFAAASSMGSSRRPTPRTRRRGWCFIKPAGWMRRRWPRCKLKYASGCCAPSSATACSRSVNVTRWAAGRTAAAKVATSGSTPRCASRVPT